MAIRLKPSENEPGGRESKTKTTVDPENVVTPSGVSFTFHVFRIRHEIDVITVLVARLFSNCSSAIVTEIFLTIESRTAVRAEVRSESVFGLGARWISPHRLRFIES